MFAIIKKIFGMFNHVQRKNFLRLQFLVVVTSLFELVGLASVAPFMSVVVNGDRQNMGLLSNFIYNYFGIVDKFEFITYFGMVVLVLLSVSSLLSMLTVWRLSVFSQHVGAEISVRLLRGYLHMDWEYHILNNSAVLMNKMVLECQRVTNYIIQPCMFLISKSILLIVLSVFAFYYNPVVAFSGVVFFSMAYFVVYKVVRKRVDLNSKFVSEISALRMKTLNESLGGVRDVLFFNKMNHFSSKYEAESNAYAEKQSVTIGLSVAPRHLMEWIAFGSVIFLIIYLTNYHNGNLAFVIPSIAIFAFLGLKLLPALQQIYSSMVQIKGNWTALDSINVDLNKFSKSDGKSDLKNLGRINRDIELSEVCFSYKSSENMVLNGVNLLIPSGKVVGLVGRSGSGKSTLIDIILGFLNPISGVVKLGGRVLNSNEFKGLRSRIGYVPQNIFLSDSTIRENIAFGIDVDLIDDLKISAVVEQAGLSEFLGNLPDGAYSKVGERGVQLSGGQRQRIGIARSLYSDIDLLIFDEATSALDGASENSIMETVNSLTNNLTIILIAHRLQTLKNCDLIYVLEGGRVVDSGAYSDLMSNSVAFNKMAGNVNVV